jgi:predicted 3-demethylubiquinone-9 3-methyltransferase (glyoxalase superfamily)
MQKITPFLWFDDQAEAAAEFYVAVLGGRIISISYYTEAGPRPAGMALVVTFEIRGQEFAALNGGPEFTFSEAVSFAVNCDTQEEIDRVWEQLSEGGAPGVCGWLKDKFGVSWQVVPTQMNEWLTGGDEAAADRVMRVIFRMTKLDIETLRQAYEGGS